MIDKRLILTIHKRLIALFGGCDGVRDLGLLESALCRPENLQAYQPGCDIFDSAACLAYGLIKNHPFVDGNKRVAAVVCELALNKAGYQMTASEEEKYLVYMKLAAGEIAQAGFSDWLRTNAVRMIN